MIACSFCGRRHHTEALRAFRPVCADGDPRPEQPGGRVYICRPCEPKRARVHRTPERERSNRGRGRGGGEDLCVWGPPPPRGDAALVPPRVR